MKIALKLAKCGGEKVSPNPLVGAVIVKDGKIIGQGYHKLYGGPHAEVYALEEAGDNAKGAVIYVTLEPCSHYGKTPPCAEALVKAGIKKAVIAVSDPNPMVSGKGIEILKKNGIEVELGVLENEAKDINKIFLKYITTKLPFVILKWAMTLDGKIAASTGESKWITSEESRYYVHKIRNRVMGIMTGINTIIMDNPLMTTRLKDGGKSPKAIILDSKLRIPLDAKILDTVSDREVIIACTKNIDNDKKVKLEQRGIKFIITPEDENGRVDLKYLIRELGNRGIDSILLECGSNLNFSAIYSGVVDEVICFIAPKIFGGDKAKTPVGGIGFENISEAQLLKNMEIQKIGEDFMIRGYL
ncbi:bifunctional diaminohydroxyphosphoribosylaminopyrimidine deaminase/5-amino-6-(5-phosphoribosylamino)uracil reductase RibD [Clostridium sp. JN-1]|uniref:bifunctional diaminohydroxyphosphoribosylaminopyrimidine deaminase/5-amino-6-(5-phosphoribosylamino)uracil reductase RibD n=1 Tax=Clostridium sp. JN-1 TaxID=2483110 RepID=UPI000F0BDBD4|nr:bifunctional diaminohydroxyphosphoribosylaminopyrimidine deaminase/5-amino-6-(5-phosphoribosylamino)uracil reductase RibD [Clostridium sp. JN-1]